MQGYSPVMGVQGYSAVMWGARVQSSDVGCFLMLWYSAVMWGAEVQSSVWGPLVQSSDVGCRGTVR